MVEIRKAVYAGSFYPAEKKELSKKINLFLKNCEQAKTPQPKTLKALIVPHAGYDYSGLIAASAYSVLEKKKVKKLILLGPSHQNYFKDILGFGGKWETPLGKTNVSSAGLEIILHDSEHSLEVQLPFLQSTLKNFDFVPLIYCETEPQKIVELVEPLITKETVLVASSDLSHYLSYEKAKSVDEKTIKSNSLIIARGFVILGLNSCGILQCETT